MTTLPPTLLAGQQVRPVLCWEYSTFCKKHVRHKTLETFTSDEGIEFVSFMCVLLVIHDFSVVIIDCVLNLKT